MPTTTLRSRRKPADRRRPSVGEAAERDRHASCRSHDIASPCRARGIAGILRPARARSGARRRRRTCSESVARSARNRWRFQATVCFDDTRRAGPGFARRTWRRLEAAMTTHRSDVRLRRSRRRLSSRVSRLVSSATVSPVVVSPATLAFAEPALDSPSARRATTPRGPILRAPSSRPWWTTWCGRPNARSCGTPSTSAARWAW